MSGTSFPVSLPDQTADREVHYGYMLPVLDARVARSIAGQQPPVKVLDVGCGSGTFTIDFANRVAASGGHVTGVDISGSSLASATMRAECLGVTNVTFVRADVGTGGVGAVPFPSNTFDVVHIQQVLAHLLQPIKAIRELLRVTKKATKESGTGGVVCLREGDLQTARFSPPSPVLNECFELIRRVHRIEGGDGEAGRHLERWVVKAGASKKKMTSRQTIWCCNTREARETYGGHWPARCSYGIFADKARALGVSQERLDEYALAWKQWIEHPEGVLEMAHCEVILTV